MARRPKLLYLVTEDWYFVSHRLPLAIAAKAAGFDVSVATRVQDHGDAIRNAGLNLIPISLSRSGLHPIREFRSIAGLAALIRGESPDLLHNVAMKPVTYGALAARAGSPKAARAIGQVMASNPIPLVIPCHRVLAANRKLGGFSATGGTEFKRKMLALEGIET